MYNNYTLTRLVFSSLIYDNSFLPRDLCMVIDKYAQYQFHVTLHDRILKNMFFLSWSRSMESYDYEYLNIECEIPCHIFHKYFIMDGMDSPSPMLRLSIDKIYYYSLSTIIEDEDDFNIEIFISKFNNETSKKLYDMTNTKCKTIYIMEIGVKEGHEPIFILTCDINNLLDVNGIIHNLLTLSYPPLWNID